MDHIKHTVRTLMSEGHKPLSWTYLSVLLLSLHYVFVVYINSTYMTQFVSEQTVGILYVIAAVINIIVLLNVSKILRRRGNYKTTLWLIAINGFCLLVMGGFRSAYFIIPAFIVYQGLELVLLLNLDIFLETLLRTQEHMGGARGIFLASSNLAFVFGPFFLGQALADGNYSRAYYIAFIFLAIMFAVIWKKFRHFKDDNYPSVNVWGTAKEFMREKDFKNIFSVNFILQFFYAWMIIYTPIYLYEHIGFSWPEIGAMFSIMLLPFVIFQIPGGLLADTKLGEKKMLVLGFLIMGLATVAIPFVTGNSFILWTAILFVTRVGAALVEVMSETYFFRHIKGKDANIMSVFRITGPLSYIILPIVAGISLTLIDFRWSFLLVGIIVLCGIKYSINLKDIR